MFLSNAEDDARIQYETGENFDRMKNLTNSTGLPVQVGSEEETPLMSKQGELNHRKHELEALGKRSCSGRRQTSSSGRGEGEEQEVECENSEEDITGSSSCEASHDSCSDSSDEDFVLPGKKKPPAKAEPPPKKPPVQKKPPNKVPPKSRKKKKNRQAAERYSLDDMNNAIAELQAAYDEQRVACGPSSSPTNQELGMVTVAKKYNIPYSTLSDRFHKFKNVPAQVRGTCMF